VLDLFVGATEVRCRVALLDADTLQPGGSGWVQLRLEHPITAVRGDRCILRVPSPSITVGGGRVVDTHPARHRRFRSEVIAALELLGRGTPVELVLHALGTQPIEWSAVVKASGIDEAIARDALAELVETGQVVLLTPDELQPGSLLMSQLGWSQLNATITGTLASYHKKWPLRLGMAREELKSKLELGTRPFDPVLRRLMSEGVIATTETTVRLAHWQPRLNQTQQRQVEALLHDFRAELYTPPPKAEWETVGPELISYLLDTGQLMRVSPDVLFDAGAFRKLVEWTIQALEAEGQVTVAGLRDHFGTTRKYALAFLEYLDERKTTRRVGDVRVKY
jgi:selenocysteine-specific elongation factor